MEARQVTSFIMRFVMTCFLFNSCSVLTDPLIYEDSAELIEEVIKDEARG